MTTLRTLALAATPGPWVALIDDYEAGTMFVTGDPKHGQSPVAGGCDFPDAAYIAAASPAVVLALLDVVDAAAFRKNVLIYDNPSEGWKGEWVAVPRADFDTLRAALARYEEVTK